MKKRIALVAAAALFGSFFFVLPEGVSADIPTVPAAHVPRSLLDREILDKGVEAYRQGDYEKESDRMGHMKAARYIGLCYENGQGLPQNYGEARK